jgi:hypothetical protein
MRPGAAYPIASYRLRETSQRRRRTDFDIESPAHLLVRLMGNQHAIGRCRRLKAGGQVDSAALGSVLSFGDASQDGQIGVDPNPDAEPSSPAGF